MMEKNYGWRSVGFAGLSFLSSASTVTCFYVGFGLESAEGFLLPLLGIGAGLGLLITLWCIKNLVNNLNQMNLASKPLDKEEELPTLAKLPTLTQNPKQSQALDDQTIANIVSDYDAEFSRDKVFNTNKKNLLSKYVNQSDKDEYKALTVMKMSFKLGSLIESGGSFKKYGIVMLLSPLYEENNNDASFKLSKDFSVTVVKQESEHSAIALQTPSDLRGKDKNSDETDILNYITDDINNEIDQKNIEEEQQNSQNLP